MMRSNNKQQRFGWWAAFKALFIFALLTAALSFGAKLPPVIRSVDVAEELNEDYTVTLTVNAEGSLYHNGNALWCYVGEMSDPAAVPDRDWVRIAKDGTASFKVHSGDYSIFVKDGYGNIGTAENQNVSIDTIVSMQLNYESLYLAPGAERRVEAELFVVGNPDMTLTWTSSNPAVATVTPEGALTAVAPGETNITVQNAEGAEQSLPVVVTDLLVLPEVNNSRTTIPAYRYTQEEAHLLDAALFSRVDEAGYGTRGGVIAAARFLALEFPYRIPYFYENGRLEIHGNINYVDGEGRYYHRGLYLSEDKYDDIVASLVGPAIWGAPLTNFMDEGYFVRGGRYPNGLDCSGFVTWALMNGGVPLGDVGAGDYAWIDTDLCDRGERIPLTMDTFYTGRVKVGDLIGKDGHIAIIIGLDEEYVYVAESLGRGVSVTVATIDGGVQRCGLYTYIMLMDSEYAEFEGEGTYTDMW